MDELRSEVHFNFHTCYIVTVGSGGTISTYRRIEETGQMINIPGCMVVDFYQGKATLLYIDDDLNKHDEFMGDNQFSIKIVNRKDGIFIYLLQDDEYYYEPLLTSDVTFEDDIQKIWNIYYNDSNLMNYVEKRPI